MKLKILFVVIMAFMIYSTSYSQKNTKIKPESIYFESVFLPSDEPDSNIVYFFYKVRLTELIFDKSDNIKPNSFSAFPTFEIEIKDNSGIVRKRLNKIDTITINDYSILNNDCEYYDGFFKTKLVANDYMAHYQVTVNNRDVYDKRVNLENPKKNDLQIIGNPILVDENSENYKPIILNNSFDVKCANPTVLFFTNQQSKDNLTSTITFLADEDNKTSDYPIKTNLQITFLNNQSIDFSKYDKTLKGNLILKDNSSLYKIEIPKEMIYPGKFKLQIKGISKKDTLNYDYTVKWYDVPKSLVNIPYAEEIMRYILNDVEIAELKSQKSKDKEGYIYKYWRKLDPTPKTYYNEAMNTYFKRADEAKAKFLTILHSDGALTSRGQIYILYGNPDSISNELNNKKSVEKWVYSKLKKQFIFEITTPGEFKLIQIIE